MDIQLKDLHSFLDVPAKKKKSKSEVNSGELREFWDKDVKYSKKKTKYWESKIKGPSTRTEPHNPAPSTLT